jgi:hypothetical protein
MPLIDSGSLVRRYDRSDGRLGRQLVLDSRSLAYTVERDGDAMATPLQSKHWERRLGILQQGDLGSCTANAATGALGTEPFYSQVGHRVLPDGVDLAEAYAVALYSAATKVDPWPGSYPPEDTGSSAAWPSARS